ncbi:hypothetical protein GY45DRAFT_575461 [Cubamyces sp. BRFM 1775]|nr:hypothetical protein GY45DRAFT_575461 [Cubamyces sp. BRFM 1775]
MVSLASPTYRPALVPPLSLLPPTRIAIPLFLSPSVSVLSGIASPASPFSRSTAPVPVLYPRPTSCCWFFNRAALYYPPLPTPFGFWSYVEPRFVSRRAFGLLLVVDLRFVEGARARPAYTLRMWGGSPCRYCIASTMQPILDSVGTGSQLRIG